MSSASAENRLRVEPSNRTVLSEANTGAATAVEERAVSAWGLAACQIPLGERLPVGDRNLVIVGVNVVEGEETVAVASVFDESRLQRRFYPRDLGEINITFALRFGR